MGDYPFRVASAMLGSELIPVFLRMKLMRLLGFKVDPTACVWARCCLRSNKLQLGREAFLNVGFFFDGADHLVIENNVRVGQFVKVITATHEIGPSTQRCTFEAITKPVHIESGCWIGAGVTILPGVVIRRGCVIGANSLVTSSTEENGLYLGSPMRRINDLPDDAASILARP